MLLIELELIELLVLGREELREVDRRIVEQLNLESSKRAIPASSSTLLTKPRVLRDRFEPTTPFVPLT